MIVGFSIDRATCFAYPRGIAQNHPFASRTSKCDWPFIQNVNKYENQDDAGNDVQTRVIEQDRDGKKEYNHQSPVYRRPQIES